MDGLHDEFVEFAQGWAAAFRDKIEQHPGHGAGRSEIGEDAELQRGNDEVIPAGPIFDDGALAAGVGDADLGREPELGGGEQGGLVEGRSGIGGSGHGESGGKTERQSTSVRRRAVPSRSNSRAAARAAVPVGAAGGAKSDGLQRVSWVTGGVKISVPMCSPSFR